MLKGGMGPFEPAEDECLEELGTGEGPFPFDEGGEASQFIGTWSERGTCIQAAIAVIYMAGGLGGRFVRVVTVKLPPTPSFQRYKSPERDVWPPNATERLFPREPSFHSPRIAKLTRVR